MMMMIIMIISNVQNIPFINRELINFEWFPHTYDTCESTSCQKSTMNCSSILSKKFILKTIDIVMIDDQIYQFINNNDDDNDQYMNVIVYDIYNQISCEHDCYRRFYLDGGQMIHMKHIQELMNEYGMYNDYIVSNKKGLTHFILYKKIDSKTKKFLYNFDLHLIVENYYYHFHLETKSNTIRNMDDQPSITMLNIKKIKKTTNDLLFFMDLDFKNVRLYERYSFLLHNNGITYRITSHEKHPPLFMVKSINKKINTFYWCIEDHMDYAYIWTRNTQSVKEHPTCSHDEHNYPLNFQPSYGFCFNNYIYLISYRWQRIAIVNVEALYSTGHHRISIIFFEEFFLCQFNEWTKPNFHWFPISQQSSGGKNHHGKQNPKHQQQQQHHHHHKHHEFIKCRTFVNDLLKHTIGISMMNNRLYISIQDNLNQIMIWENFNETTINNIDHFTLGRYGYWVKITDSGFYTIWNKMSFVKQYDPHNNNSHHINPIAISMLNTTVNCDDEYDVGSKTYFVGHLLCQQFGQLIDLYWETTKQPECTKFELHYTNMTHNDDHQQQRQNNGHNYRFVKISGQNELYTIVMNANYDKIETLKSPVNVWRRKPGNTHIEYMGKLCWSIDGNEIRLINTGNNIDHNKFNVDYDDNECGITAYFTSTISYGFIGKINKLYLVSLKQFEMIIVDAKLLYDYHNQNNRWHTVRRISLHFSTIFKCQSKHHH